MFTKQYFLSSIFQKFSMGYHCRIFVHNFALGQEIVGYRKKKPETGLSCLITLQIFKMIVYFISFRADQSFVSVKTETSEPVGFLHTYGDN